VSRHVVTGVGKAGMVVLAKMCPKAQVWMVWDRAARWWVRWCLGSWCPRYIHPSLLIAAPSEERTNPKWGEKKSW